MVGRYVLFLVLLTVFTTAFAKGGGSKGGGTKNGGGSYPKQKWSPAPAPRQNPSPAPRQNPSPAPRQNPSPAPRQNPSPAPRQNPSPPDYSRPPAHSPSNPSYAPSGPVGPITPPKNKGIGGVGSHTAAGVAGAVMGNRLRGPKIKIYVPRTRYGGNRRRYHDDGRDYDYSDSSSEEYFEPYVVGPNGRYRLPESRPGYKLTPEGEQIYRMTHVMNTLCEKLQQPSACAMLRMQGVRPFTNPNSIFNQPGPSNPVETPDKANVSGQNNTVVLNGTDAFIDNKPGSNSTAVDGTKLYPSLPDPVAPPVNIPEDMKLDPAVLDRVPRHAPENAAELPHFSDDRLQVAADMFKILDGM